MKPQQQHHADQLEDLLSSHMDQYQNVSAHMQSAVSDGVDPDVRTMAMLARQLQRSPALMPDPAFAQRLERKVLAHSVHRIQAQRARNNRPWLIDRGSLLRVQLLVATLLFCVVAGTGTMLAMAATVSNPDNPLYGMKVWEQHVQLSLATSPQSRADVSLHIIRDRLNIISSLTDTSHANEYQQALQEIKAQTDDVTSVINTLPPGSDRDTLSSGLATLKTTIRQTLYRTLVKLPFAEQLTTTTFLGQLGTPMPTIQQVTIVIITHPTSQATITITGTNLTNSTQLMINNQRIASNCQFQSNTCVFIIPWHDKNRPDGIAVINADGTVAQTTNFLFVSGDGNNNSGNNGKSGETGDNGNTNGNSGGTGNNSNTKDGTNSSNSNTNGNGKGNGNGNSNEGHQHSNTTNTAKPTSTPNPHK